MSRDRPQWWLYMNMEHMRKETVLVDHLPCARYYVRCFIYQYFVRYKPTYESYWYCSSNLWMSKLRPILGFDLLFSEFQLCVSWCQLNISVTSISKNKFSIVPLWIHISPLSSLHLFRVVRCQYMENGIFSTENQMPQLIFMLVLYPENLLNLFILIFFFFFAGVFWVFYI